MAVSTTQTREGSVRLVIPSPSKYKLTKKAPVFYNPVMALNRDISVLLLQTLKPESAVDLLAATGVRALRIKKEAKIKYVYVNDANPLAVRLIKRNFKLNRLSAKISNLRAHEFLATRYKLKHKKFGYLDIDPFGSPVPFLDAGVKAIEERGGVIGVTATDTSLLCGTYPKACIRKYGARPLRSRIMNELGMRILIKKIQETGAQYDLALTPLFCHATRHYMRAYLQAVKGAEKTDKILEQVGLFEGAGPLWLGPLYDEALTQKMHKLAVKSKLVKQETKELLFTIRKESEVRQVGFYDLAEFSLRQVPKISKVLGALQKRGYSAARTHFSKTGIKTNATKEAFVRLLHML